MRHAQRRFMPFSPVAAVGAACAIGTAICVLPALAQDAENIRYVSASSLNLRASAAATADVLQRWRLNQRLSLVKQGDRWCEVQSVDGTQRGHVDCSFLQRTPVTLAQIEAESTEAALALLRLQPPISAMTHQWTHGLERDAAESRRLIDALLQQFDRHFAYSPSLATYRDIDAVLRQLRVDAGVRERPELAPLAQLLDARTAQMPALRAAFDADFAKDPREPLRRSALGGLAALIDHRQAQARQRFGDRRGPPVAPSFFTQGRWAIGWAGGPLAVAQTPAAGEGALFHVQFNGSGVWALNGVVEMAKQHRLALRAQWGELKSDALELSQSQVSAAGAVETLRLDTRLQAWGVTERGLVPGTVRRAAFFGDACTANSGQGTRAEVVFADAVPGPLLAVFVSSAPIEPSRVRVQMQRRSFLAPLRDLWENTLTERQTLSVDLDGDGVPDLRVVVSNDRAVGQAPLGQHVSFRHVAGWYANDVYSLEANIDGAWQTLSLYNVQTCT